MKTVEDLRHLIEYVDWLENKYDVARFYFNANIDKFSEVTKEDLKEDRMLNRFEFQYTENE